MKGRIEKMMTGVQKLDSVALLFTRLLLAYGLYQPAIMKWKHIDATAQWFESLGYPAPLLNVYLAGSTEMLGVILLTLGFGTRIIAMPLMFVMVIAITTVHWHNGFSAGDNGFEIPLYYLAMFFMLMAFGSGKLSLDYLMRKNK